jgi:hypothetical protein
LWGWFGVDWWIWSLVVIAKVKNWNSIINDDGDFLTSDVEEHFEGTIAGIFGVFEHSMDSLWDSSNSRSRGKEPAISKSTLFGSFNRDTLTSPK